MENIITFLADETTLLFKWQTLFGSVIGVLGALTVALFIFLVNYRYQKRKDLRESLRITEITLALGLSDIYDTEKSLEEFLKRLEGVVIEPLKNGVDQSKYFLNETNFPSLSIHLDSSLLKAKYKSYYVHNKILIITRNIRNINRALEDMKAKYEDIILKGKFLIERGATPVNQQQEYLQNNESFASFVKSGIAQLQKAKRVFAETKTYNLKLLEKKRLAVWRLEGTNFKLFCKNKQIEEYKSTLECLDRVDLEISSEVDKLLMEAEKRSESNNKFIAKSYFNECMKDILKKIKSIFKFKQKGG